MSSSHHAIQVYHQHIQAPVRLLELPPELLASVTSENPPSLTLKSAQAPGLHGNGVGSGNALLCTSSKTYEIKQVQSSNTLLLLRPSAEDGAEDGSVTSLSAFATCTGTLELLPYIPSAKTRSPREWLVSLLPGYDTDTEHVPTSAYSKTALFEEIPYSDGELEAEWVGLVAFQAQMKCFLPSAKAMLELWKMVSASAGTYGSSMAGQLSNDRLIDDTEGFPREMTQAMLQRLSNSGSLPPNATCTLDRSTTVSWLGDRLLEAATPDELLQPVPVLLDMWRSLVPEEWQGDVTRERLVDLNKYKTLAQALDAGGATAATQESKTDSKRKTGPAARNWHDKLKRSKP